MLVLLDTNAYLRLAKRVRPVLGVAFGQKGYVLTVHKSVEDEVRRNPRLKAKYPWFEDSQFSDERLAKQIRLTADEKQTVQVNAELIRDIYGALEANGDLTKSWRLAKHTVFVKIFGPKNVRPYDQE